MADLTFLKAKPSGSTDGKQIIVNAYGTQPAYNASPTLTNASTGSYGTLFHTAVSGTTAGTFDEVWLYAANFHTAAINLTIQWGGNTGADEITVPIPVKAGLTLVIPGLVLQNSQKVCAYVPTTGEANKITLVGYVNSIA